MDNFANRTLLVVNRSTMTYFLMSRMRHYLYYKFDSVLRKKAGFTTFSMRMSVCQQSVLKLTSSVGLL